MKAIVKGTIQEISTIDIRQTQSGKFPSQQLLISEPDGKYQNPLIFNCWGEKCKQLENLQLGMQVSVEFFIKSNYAKPRWYTNLQVISITVMNNNDNKIDNEF